MHRGYKKHTYSVGKGKGTDEISSLRIEILPILWSKVFADLGVVEEKAVILQSVNRLIFNSIVLEADM